MSFNFRPYDKDQMYLLPESIDDWVPEDSFARFISDVVDHLWGQGRLGAFCDGRNELGAGGAAFHPVLMIKLLLYCYCQGVMSSRKIAEGVLKNVELRFLTANQLPRYRAIAEFRQRYLSALEGLFVEVLTLCQEAGLAQMGRVALDGRKVQGNASLDKHRTKESLGREREELEKEVDRLLREATQTDEKEAGMGASSNDLPLEFRSKQDRLRRIREAHQRLVDKELDAKEEQAAKNAQSGGDTELYIATQKDHKQRKAMREQKAPRGRKPKGMTPRQEMERKLQTQKGKNAYRERGCTIEPVFGQMWTRGFNRFLLRGVTKVKAEWSLWCTCHNLLKLWFAGGLTA